MKIHEIVCCHLVGAITIVRIHLFVTDEDTPESGSLECLIATNSVFAMSQHMLCIFHALVQQLRTLIYPHLPARTVKGKHKITRLGKQYCVLLYRWLQQQSTYVETKAEYDASYLYTLLNIFLNRPKITKDLSIECIKAIRKFQDHLRMKENKLGNHVQMDTPNCNKVCTSPPTESMNSSIKGGPSRVLLLGNMGLDRSTEHMMKGINIRWVLVCVLSTFYWFHQCVYPYLLLSICTAQDVPLSIVSVFVYTRYPV